jgi:ribonuclease-3
MTPAHLGELQQAVGHRFRDPGFLERALTHRSAVGDSSEDSPPSSNEQLEYLGDAVLGLLVSDGLLAAFPHWTEGRLSRARARLVSAPSLSAIAEGLQLGRYLLLGRGEEKTGGRSKPALLANAFEAVVAAVYLDAGLEAARELVRRTLLSAAFGAEGQGLGRADFKSELQELLQKSGLSPASYRIVRESGPDHRKSFLVEVAVAGGATAAGTGLTKKEAEQAAAKEILEVLRGVEAGQSHE